MLSTSTSKQQPQPSDSLSQAQVLSSKAKHYFEKGLYAPMVANLQAAIQLAPNERTFYAQLANGLIRMKRIEEAAKVLHKRAEIIDNNQAMEMYTNGQAKVEGGDYQSALAYLDSAISLQPASPTFLKQRAAIHFKMNAFADGVRDYVDSVLCENIKKIVQ
jgi:tetratricopeptide (TPR) repeat protein